MKKRQEIYDLYWYFANERQNIFIKKLNGDEDLQLKIIEIKRCSNIEFNKEVKSDIKMSK